MKRSNDFIKDSALYLISSPIGNLNDLSKRQIETLNLVDYLFCEDTRKTSILLKSLEISKPLDSYHDHSTIDKENKIISLIKEGYNVGLISDCGTPIISDPGFEVVRRCIDEDIRVIPIPGVTALITALTISSLPPKPFLFYGFLDKKKSKMEKELESIKDYPFSIIFYESPLRINDTLKVMFEVLGDRKVSVSRELTKYYEETIYLSLSEYNEFPVDLKGEMVIVLEGLKENINKNIDIIKEMDKIIKEGYSIMDASKILKNRTGLSKNYIYNEYIKEKK